MRACAPGSTQHQQPPKGAKTVPKGRKCGQLEQDQVIKLRTKAKPINRISVPDALLERYQVTEGDGVPGRHEKRRGHADTVRRNVDGL